MKIYNGVLYLKTNCSGLTWDDHLGMNIGPETQSVWDAIIKNRPECTPFANQGWDIFDDVADLDPAKPKGSHVFHPTTGQQGVSDVTTSQSTESQPIETQTQTQPQVPPQEDSPDWDISQLGHDMAASHSETQTDTGDNDDDQDHLPTFSASSTQSLPPQPFTPARLSLKRAAPPSAGASVSKHVRPSSSHAEAVHSLAGALDRFGTTFKESSHALAAAINASPERNARVAKARSILYEKEEWLDRRQKVQLANKFIDPHKADTYLYHVSLPSPDRKTWVAVELDLDESFD